MLTLELNDCTYTCVYKPPYIKRTSNQFCSLNTGGYVTGVVSVDLKYINLTNIIRNLVQNLEIPNRISGKTKEMEKPDERPTTGKYVSTKTL